ncbi:MAG: hypothetical protein ACOYXU_02255 [Nitrospirota bacterium]
MKFVCLNCEAFMLFQKVEKPGEGSLGVEFLCPKCSARFSMVTNPGETQMVQALGVKIGGRTTAPEAFELTRGTLKDAAECPMPEMVAKAGATSAKPAAAESAGGGSCPFSSMVAGMGAGSSTEAAGLEWSAEALDRLAKIPEFVRPTVKMDVEAYARKTGESFVTQAMMDRYKNGADGMRWSGDAQQRLENIPFFIRPMAKKEIERMAREAGRTEVTVEVMEQAKTAFAKFMGG